MISEGQIRARTRRKINEMEEALEDGSEGGEINLVPFLDIVTNVIIFMLATIVMTLPMGKLDVATPRYDDRPAESAQPPGEPKPMLNLSVSISGTGFIVSGSGATLFEDDIPGKLPTVPMKAGQYDYDKLAKVLAKIKEAFPEEGRAVLSANPDIPYEVVVGTMDTLREQPGKQCKRACMDKNLTPQGCPPDQLGFVGECMFPEIQLGTGG